MNYLNDGNKHFHYNFLNIIILKNIVNVRNQISTDQTIINNFNNKCFHLPNSKKNTKKKLIKNV